MEKIEKEYISEAKLGMKQVEVELDQAIPYIIFLVSPIFIVLLIALQKGT